MVWIAEKSPVGGGVGREDNIGMRHRMAQLRAENGRDVTEDISGLWGWHSRQQSRDLEDGTTDSKVW